MENRYLVTQEPAASYHETLEEAIAAMISEDAEIWEKDSNGCYIKLYLN